MALATRRMITSGFEKRCATCPSAENRRLGAGSLGPNCSSRFAASPLVSPTDSSLTVMRPARSGDRSPPQSLERSRAVTASTTTQSRNTPMLMRSHTPIHGVGRFASMPGRIDAGQRAKHDEDHHRRDGVQTEPRSECRCPESHREHHEENRHHRKNDVHRVGQRSAARCQHLAEVHRRPDEAERRRRRPSRRRRRAAAGSDEPTSRRRTRRRPSARCRRWPASTHSDLVGAPIADSSLTV